jgi:hypothetical protein
MTINCNNKENKLKRKEGKGSRVLYTRGWPEARLSNASKPKRDHARAVTTTIAENRTYYIPYSDIQLRGELPYKLTLRQDIKEWNSLTSYSSIG